MCGKLLKSIFIDAVDEDFILELRNAGVRRLVDMLAHIRDEYAP